MTELEMPEWAGVFAGFVFNFYIMLRIITVYLYKEMDKSGRL